MNTKVYRTNFLQDGTILCVLEGSADTYLEATPLGLGSLRLDAMRVAEGLRGQGISHELFREVLQFAGGAAIHTIEGWLTGTNALAARIGLDKGLSPADAAAAAPLGRTAMKFGFARIEFDSFIGLFRALR